MGQLPLTFHPQPYGDLWAVPVGGRTVLFVDNRKPSTRSSNGSPNASALPIVDVNTFLPPDGHGEVGEIELMRSSEEEKNQQVANVEAFRQTHATEAAPRLKHLQKVASERKNSFDALMEAAKVC